MKKQKQMCDFHELQDFTMTGNTLNKGRDQAKALEEIKGFFSVYTNDLYF